jgi:hypothetical protein
VVCTVHYDLLSATTTAAIVVLVTGFPPSFASSLQLRFEEGYDSGEGLLLGLLHCSMMMMLIVDKT